MSLKSKREIIKLSARCFLRVKVVKKKIIIAAWTTFSLQLTHDTHSTLIHMWPPSLYFIVHFYKMRCEIIHVETYSEKDTFWL
jgi:hypothetical protein